MLAAGLARLARLLNALLRRLDIAVIRRSNLDALEQAYERLHGTLHPSFQPGPLPPGAKAYLRADNPRLQDLRRRYQGHPAAAHTQWRQDYVDGNVDLHRFRGDNAFVWQVRAGISESQYLLTAYHARDVDALGLLGRLGEDGAFGAYTFADPDGRPVSRDLLDSVLEINFLERAVGLTRRPGAVVLDIGAGYGRLAHRLVEGLPGLGRVYCTDAVAEATFLCEYYLRFRGVAEAATVLPLDKAEHTLDGLAIDLVTNVHSFAECPQDVVAWWLQALGRARVRHLMIVPNGGPTLLSTEADGSRRDLLPLVRAAGFDLVTAERKYERAPPLQRLGLFPDVWYLLFEKRDGAGGTARR